MWAWESLLSLLRPGLPNPVSLPLDQQMFNYHSSFLFFFIGATIIFKSLQYLFKEVLQSLESS